MKKMVIFHTTVKTVDPLSALAAKYLPDYTVNNILDDSILPELLESPKNMQQVYERISILLSAVKSADFILLACSSIGGYKDFSPKINSIPVLRIDEQMIVKAIDNGGSIAVLATLKTTLQPTMDFCLTVLRQMKKEDISFESYLLDKAYDCGKKGDMSGHDSIIKTCIAEIEDKFQSIILAQASMAQAVKNHPALGKKILTSPELCFQNLQNQYG
ncbi:MAG: hypothetical protein B0D92_08505 [Spirochaeta sp. LUC14_002_19_P3]|nr:MAG: hypothetical protein B0D92_08505 [Spirochaeta sp. LUC14_002_19_P3]